MIIAGALVGLRGIYQYFFGLGWTMEYLNQVKNDLSSYQYAKNVLFSKRAFSTFFSPDMLAGYLAMVMPLAGGFLIDNLKFRKKLVLASISLFIISICIGLTKSLGGWLSLFAGSIIFFILFLKELPHLDHKKVIKLAAIVLTVIILISTATVIKRANQFIDFTNPQNSILQRLYYWKSTLKMIKDFPLTGIGWGNFGTAYARYKLQGANEIKNAHNSYLQIWAEAGLLGVIATVWLIFIFFREGLQGLKEPGEKGFKIGLIAAGFSFLTHNLIDYDYYISQVSFHWWIILGLTVAIRGKKGLMGSDPPHRITWMKGLTPRVLIAILLLVIATLMVRSHLATQHFENGLFLFRDNKNDEAIIELKKAQTLDFEYDLYHLALAKSYERKIEQNNLGPADPLFDEVVREYRKAISLNPYYPFHYRDLGLFFLKHNMIKEAISEFRKAVYFYPTNPDLHNYLRITYQKVNKGR